MNFICLIILVPFLSLINASIRPFVDVEANHKIYSLSENHLNFQDAKKFCGSLNGSLARIHTMEELESLVKKLHETGVQVPKQIWIGVFGHESPDTKILCPSLIHLKSLKPEKCKKEKRFLCQFHVNLEFVQQ